MLENTLFRLHNSKKLNVGYIGGSITEGAGASDPWNTSWASRTSKWFTEAYPDVKFEFRNAAIGGTNSDFGVYRINHDLLDQLYPELVFIEFSVNDYKWTYDGIYSAMEGMVRKIFTRNPTADIIFVYTCTKYLEEDIVKGQEFDSHDAHAAVAHYYGGIPGISIGEALRHAIHTKCGGDWMKLTTDSVHPNDEGYLICFEALRDELKRLLDGREAPVALTERVLPPATAKYDLTKAHLIDTSFATVSEGDWTYGHEWVGHGHYPNTCSTSTPGAWMELKFTGSRVGFYLTLADDAGFFSWQIDDGPVNDENPFSFRDNPNALPCELPYGEHTLRVTLKDIPENREGKMRHLTAFLVS